MPFPVDLPEGPRVVRLDVPPVSVPDAFLTALAAHLGPEGVVVADSVLDDAGRDWWPLSAVWATDGRIPARPAVVARPTDAEGVVAAVRLAAEHGVPLTPAAGRSGVCGGAVPVAGGVALDLTGLAGHPRRRHHLTAAAGPPRHLRRRPRTGTGRRTASPSATGPNPWPSPPSEGGWPAGVPVNTRRDTGRSKTWWSGLEVVDGRGRRFRTGGHPRAATGPDLTQVFVGSEGTLGVITEATLRVRPRPAGSGWAAYRFERFADGLDAIRRLAAAGRHPGRPAALRPGRVDPELLRRPLRR